MAGLLSWNSREQFTASCTAGKQLTAPSKVDTVKPNHVEVAVLPYICSTFSLVVEDLSTRSRSSRIGFVVRGVQLSRCLRV